MTPLRKLTFLILIFLLIFIFLIISKNYFLSIIVLLSISSLLHKWYLLLTEELVIYELMKSGGKLELKSIIDSFGEKTQKVVRNLKNKQIVEYDGKDIILKISDYKFSMTKWRRSNKKS